MNLDPEKPHRQVWMEAIAWLGPGVIDVDQHSDMLLTAANPSPAACRDTKLLGALPSKACGLPQISLGYAC